MDFRPGYFDEKRCKLKLKKYVHCTNPGPPKTVLSRTSLHTEYFSQTTTKVRQRTFPKDRPEPQRVRRDTRLLREGQVNSMKEGVLKTPFWVLLGVVRDKTRIKIISAPIILSTIVNGGWGLIYYTILLFLEIRLRKGESLPYSLVPLVFWLRRMDTGGILLEWEFSLKQRERVRWLTGWHRDDTRSNRETLCFWESTSLYPHPGVTMSRELSSGPRTVSITL